MAYTTALGHTPTFSISKDGDDISAKIGDRVLSIRVESRDGGGEADVVDIALDDRDWNITAPSIGDGSASLSVALGYAETVLWALGTFQVDEVSFDWTPKIMRLHGNSLGMTTNAKAPIIASYDGKTLGDIVGSIAESAGVEPKVDPALAGIQVPYWNQSTSSMHMLQDLERKFNGLAKFSDGYLSFTQRGTGDSASGTSIGTFVLTPEDFGPGGCSIKTTNNSSFSQVQAGWWDAVNNQVQWVTSSVTGSPNSQVPFTVRRVHPSQAEAQAVADSTMSQLNRKCKEGTLVLAKGAPSIRGGQGFAIQGCRDGIDGSYLVRRAIHTLEKEGGITTVLDVFDEGNGVDFAEESTDGTVSFDGIPATTLPVGGIGHM